MCLLCHGDWPGRPVRRSATPGPRPALRTEPWTQSHPLASTSVLGTTVVDVGRQEGSVHVPSGASFLSRLSMACLRNSALKMNF